MGNKYSLQKTNEGYIIRTDFHDFLYDKNKLLTHVYDNLGGDYYKVSQNIYGDIKVLEHASDSLSYKYDENNLKYIDTKGNEVNCNIKFIKTEKYKDFWLYEIANSLVTNMTSI